MPSSHNAQGGNVSCGLDSGPQGKANYLKRWAGMFRGHHAKKAGKVKKGSEPLGDGPGKWLRTIRRNGTEKGDFGKTSFKK